MTDQCINVRAAHVVGTPHFSLGTRRGRHGFGEVDSTGRGGGDPEKDTSPAALAGSVDVHGLVQDALDELIAPVLSKLGDLSAWAHAADRALLQRC